MEFHFANVWEAIADAQGDYTALICDGHSRSWREFDERAARVAGFLSAHGIGAGSKVGILMHNCNEYIETQYGIFKVRACPINVNYRYKADELVYLLDNADCEAVVYHATYAMRVEDIRKKLPRIKLWVQVDDGTEELLPDAVDFEGSVQDCTPAPRIDRPASDLYMLYTGGTTGMPKGVMYSNGLICQRLMSMSLASRGLTPPESFAELPALLDTLRATENVPVSLPACPLMHGTGMWGGTMIPLSLGGTVVTIPRLGFDADLLLTLVGRHSVTDLVIVGDAFAKPMVAALDKARARGDSYALASLKQILSSGVMWSTEVKARLLEHHDMSLLDSMGSSEGAMGISVSSRSASVKTAKFDLNDGVRVFTDDDREVKPGSGEVGKIATSGMVPIGYYKDPAKSAETFREIGDIRYSFPGDYARIEADGSIILLGRGNMCINTAGEKVFPEEVEEAVKRHPAINDCLVVGIPDEHFGERVVAVVSMLPCNDANERAVIDFTADQIAGYKTPRHLVVVDEIRRAPNGKADYQWAKRSALEALG